MELHRGTYTVQALIKKYNRKLEYALRELEIKEVQLFISKSSKRKQFSERLNIVIKDAWKELLTLQFHAFLRLWEIHTKLRQHLARKFFYASDDPVLALCFLYALHLSNTIKAALCSDNLTSTVSLKSMGK